MASAFANISSLKILRLEENEIIEPTGWQAISNLLQTRNTSLVELNLGMNKIDNEASVFLANALTNSPSLKILTLGSNRRINTVGWRAFSTCFQSLALDELDLSMNRITDDTVFLTNTLANMLTLKRLSLNRIAPITTTRLRGFSALLRNPNSALEELKLCNIGIDDRVAVEYASSLTNNSSLQIMGLEGNPISHVGWQAFSQLVWDKSSIMDTFYSNHTLHRLHDENSDGVPSELNDSLRLNRNGNKKEVVRQKIILSHFQGENINLREFLDMELKVMPCAIAWVGKDTLGCSLLYQLVRARISLIDH